jgi:hypothetical protein
MRRKIMKARIKKNIMQTAAIFTTVVMLCSIVKLPVAYAYFTAGGESETLTFTIKKADGKTMANVFFIDKFLIEENEESESETETDGTGSPGSAGTLGGTGSPGGGEMMLMGLAAGSDNPPSSPGPVPGLNRSLSLNAADLNPGSLDALFGADLESIEEKLSGEDRVQAEIRLEDGFDPGEIYVPSVELHYNENSAFALSGELNEDGALVVDFDRSQVAAWFEETGESMEQVAFSISGEGYAGGLDRFLFTGEAAIKLKGSYETKETAITGSGAFFIPDPGETIAETYLLENQNGALLEGARWALDTPVAVEGVEIDLETGALTVYSNAAPGPVTVLAAIELEGRILASQKTIALYEKPASIITGADTITVPLPGETALEQYTVEPPAGLTLTGVTWELLQETNGICADETGLVSVSSDTAAESFTLSARLEFAGVGNLLIQEKEILLHNIRIGAVEVTGTETMVIPDGEPLQQYYRALVLDAEGTVLENEPVTWSLESAAGSGMSLDAEGVLTVEQHAASGNITVQATSVRDPGISGSLSVTLEAPAREEREEEKTESPPAEEERLNIEGETLILIPAEGEAITVTYTALDNNRQPLQNALFRLLQEHEGVTLTENGELTVDSGAAEGEIIILASYRESEETAGNPEDGEEAEQDSTLLTGELRVTLALPVPTDPAVEDPVPPAEGGGENDGEGNNGDENGGGGSGEEDDTPPGKEEEPPALEEPPAEEGDGGDSNNEDEEDDNVEDEEEEDNDDDENNGGADGSGGVIDDDKDSADGAGDEDDEDDEGDNDDGDNEDEDEGDNDNAGDGSGGGEDQDLIGSAAGRDEEETGSPDS